MEEKIKQLKEKFESLEEFQKEKKEKDTKHAESIKTIVSGISTVTKEIGDLKKEISKEVLVKFEETKEKKYYGGIGVKEYKTLTYDSVKALTWAKEKDICLTLDKKSFEKIAESQLLDFVDVSTDPKVTYPKVIKIED